MKKQNYNFPSLGYNSYAVRQGSIIKNRILSIINDVFSGHRPTCPSLSTRFICHIAVKEYPNTTLLLKLSAPIQLYFIHDKEDKSFR